MIESLKVRWTIIVIVLVSALLYVLPNFIKTSDDWFFSKNKLIYGLDIQGGLHLVLGVDVETVIEEKTARLAKSLQSDAKERSIHYVSVAVLPDARESIVIKLANSADGTAFEAFLNEYYANTLQITDRAANQLTIRYFDTVIAEYRKQIVEQAIEVIRNRIDEFGVSEPSIVAQGTNRILVQLPGIKDAVRAKELINKAARLYFRKVNSEVTAENLQKLIAEAEKTGGFALGGKEDVAYTHYIKKLNEALEGKLPANTRVEFEKLENAASLEAGRKPILVDTDSDLDGGNLDDASVRADEFGKPEVTFKFNVEGRKKFAEITEKATGGAIAIVLDDVIKSVASVHEKINSDSARITLGGGRSYDESKNEATLIATALRAGSLPAALEQMEERTVGPSLGAESVEAGKWAAMVGCLITFVFMALYYRGLGIVADIGLATNVLLVLAILTSLGATLTLPGISGLALTVGMAVDANVIIFERIKEEYRKGISLKAAIRDGFSHAFTAIFDSNVTAIATCLALYYFGTGPVRGFAVTLVAGIATSMFTAIFLSRSILEVLTNKFGDRFFISVPPQAKQG